MRLDKALEFAVILAWEDLVKTAAPSSVRIEYRCEPGTSLDYLSVWSVTAADEQYLVCDYRRLPSSAHPSEVRFGNGHHSDRLAQSLDFIIKNRDHFTRPAGARPDGLVLIDPPTGVERTEAARWMREIRAAASFSGAAVERRVPLPWMSLNDCRAGSGSR
jgi:hypothetical protein